MTTRIGLISDTHDLLRPEALGFLEGCDLIVHAGDIIGPQVLDALAAIAPVVAVRGNHDKDAWADRLSATELFEAGGIFIYVIHNLGELDIDPVVAGVSVVVSGHTHQPSISEKNGVLFVNPGSAGRRRFTLPISIGEITIDAGVAAARWIELDVATA